MEQVSQAQSVVYAALPFMIPRGGLYGVFGNLDLFNQGKGNPNKFMEPLKRLGAISNKFVWDGFAYFDSIKDPADKMGRDIHFTRFLNFFRTVLSPWIARYTIMDEKCAPPNNNIADIISEFGRTKQAADEYVKLTEVTKPASIYRSKDEKKMIVPNTEFFIFDSRLMWPKYTGPDKRTKKARSKPRPKPGVVCRKLAEQTPNPIWKKLFNKAADLEFEYRGVQWGEIIISTDSKTGKPFIQEKLLPMNALEDTDDEKNTLRQIISLNCSIEVHYGKEVRIKMTPLLGEYNFTGYYYGDREEPREVGKFAELESERQVDESVAAHVLQLCTDNTARRMAPATNMDIDEQELDINSIDLTAAPLEEDEGNVSEQPDAEEKDFKQLAADNRGKKRVMPTLERPPDVHVQQEVDFKEREADLISLAEGMNKRLVPPPASEETVVPPAKKQKTPAAPPAKNAKKKSAAEVSS